MMNFQEVENQFGQLKKRYGSGNISTAEFDSKREQLKVRDSHGRWWTKGRDGDWYYYNGSTWTPGIPPGVYTNDNFNHPPPLESEYPPPAGLMQHSPGKKPPSVFSWYWYLKVLRLYASFSGRAEAREYWSFVLSNLFIAIMLTIIGRAIGAGALVLLYWLAVLVPSLAVGVRRLHDTNRSGWYFLIGLIPIVGGIVLLVFFALAGDRGPNQYGADPKAAY